MQVVEWKSQDFEPGLSEGGIYVLFTITFSTVNSDSLKKILGLEKTKMKIYLVGMTVWEYPEILQWTPLALP